MIEFLTGITLITVLIVLLTIMILVVREGLIQKKDIVILVNDEKSIRTLTGETLLVILDRAGLHLPSACGGKGTCGQCKLTIKKGGGAVRPNELALISRNEVNRGMRLACQLVVKDDMQVQLSEEIFGVKRWECTVQSNQSIATFIKELVLQLPPGETIDFRAGSYVMVECPVYVTDFQDFEIAPEFRPEWDRHDLWRYHARAKDPTGRAYSMANHPDENSIIMLNVRIATPPPGSPPDIPPGIVSSYLFSLKPGDKVDVFGPYGHFFARETQNEMVFIGGGAGMAPIRSHIFDQLLRIRTTRKMTFWYGARSLKELFYENDFNNLQQRFDNFEWHVALSEPKPEDQWQGYTGLIHNVVYEQFLKDHPAPEDCEYYLCGPPMMNTAVIKMLENLGVERNNILLDEFGS